MWSKKRIMWFVLMIFTMAVIFYFSNQSGEKSNTVGNVVAQTINITASSETVDESHTELMFGLDLRKLAHIGLFAALGVCAIGWIAAVPKAVFICLGYAVFDEFHQYFIVGRNAKVTDVLIDAIGFVLAIISVDIFQKIKRKVLRNRRSREL